MFKRFAFAVLAAFSFCLAAPQISEATPTDHNTTWSYGGLFIDAYMEGLPGNEFLVSFENSAGTQVTVWANAQLTPLCPGQPLLRLHPNYESAEDLAKMVISAGLARKPVHVWFEASGGICYLKALTVSM